MDEEVNARLERLINSQKDKDKDARPVILIERGKLDLKSPILEWGIGNYKIDPTRIINVSPNNKTTHEKGSAQGGSEAPENILAQAMTVFMEYDLASDLDWLARGLKVKRYFDLMKLLQHRGHPKTKSKLPGDATGKGPWLSVVRFGVGRNENAPIIVIRTPEMGLQPSLMSPYLAFLFKAISAISSQLAHEQEHKWEWPLRVSQFGAQGSSSKDTKYVPGERVRVIGSLFLGVEIARDVTVTAEDKHGGGKLKATFKHSEDSTDAAPHRKAQDADQRYETWAKDKKYEERTEKGTKVLRPSGETKLTKDDYHQYTISKHESNLQAYAVVSLCTPAGVYDFLREKITGPDVVKRLIEHYNLTDSLVEAKKKALQKPRHDYPVKDMKTVPQKEKALAERLKGIEVFEIRKKDLDNLRKYSEELATDKDKIDAAQLVPGSIFRWNTDALKVQEIKLAKGSPFYEMENSSKHAVKVKEKEEENATLAEVLEKVRMMYTEPPTDSDAALYPDGTISLTGGYFIGEDDKVVADKLKIRGVNMEDYHVLRVLRSAIAKGVSEESDYPMIMQWRIDRINCDPKEIDARVLAKFNEYIKKPTLSVDDYVKVILWGLGGVLKEDVPECAYWGLVNTIRDMRPDGKQLLHGHMWSFVPKEEQKEKGFIVPDPFCIEIATDFVNELAEIKATKEERTKDGKMGPAGGIAGIENILKEEKDLIKLKSLANAVKNASSGEVETKAKELMTFLKNNCSFDAERDKLKTWLRPGGKWAGVTAPTLQDVGKGPYKDEKFGGAAVDRAFYKSCNMMALQTMAHKYFFE